jgi:DNA-binding GntR family transcriptional regulator
MRELHVGVSVAEINREGIDEIYRLRALLEGDLAAEAAARVSPALLKELREINKAYRQATRSKNVPAARTANFQFHAAIWAGANSPFAVGLLNSLWARAPWQTTGLVKERNQKTIIEHDEVIDGLATGDPDLARNALSAHIRSGQKDYHLSFDKVT